MGIGHELGVSEKNSRAHGRNSESFCVHSPPLFSAFIFCPEGEIGSERITVSHRFRGSLLNLYLEVQR